MLDSLLAFVPSAAQLYQGFKQKQLAKNLKPDNYIPGAVQEKETRARARTNQTQVPGQARAEEKLDSATSNAVSATRRNAKDSATVLEKVQEADAVTKAATQDMNARVENFKLKNEEELDQALSEKAGYQMQNRNRYNAAKSALEGSSTQNFYNAATNAATGAILTGVGKKKENSAENSNITSTDNLVEDSVDQSLNVDEVSKGAKLPRGKNTPFSYFNDPLKYFYDALRTPNLIPNQ